jgi:hypothetical protein
MQDGYSLTAVMVPNVSISQKKAGWAWESDVAILSHYKVASPGYASAGIKRFNSTSNRPPISSANTSLC